MLVAKSIEILTGTNGRFAEIGVGSGCISISILVNVPAAAALASDLSSGAIQVAARNAQRHGVDERIALIEADLLRGVADRNFDLIVSNPPYVPVADIDGLQPEVRDYEPALALTDGGDGLSIVKRIISDAPSQLRAGGYLVLEIGFNQARAVEKLFDAAIWEQIRFCPIFRAYLEW